MTAVLHFTHKIKRTFYAYKAEACSGVVVTREVGILSNAPVLWSEAMDVAIF